MVPQPVPSDGDLTESSSDLGTKSIRSADGLSASLYPELRKLARAKMSRERADHTLQPTALINELYLRLLRNPEFVWKDKNHFLLAASCAMRNLLVDHAREKRSEKRGSGTIRLHPVQVGTASETTSEDILDVDAALLRLAGAEPRMARVVELKFFGELTFSEIAKALSIHERTAKRDWTLARAWLKKYLDESNQHERNRMGED